MTAWSAYVLISFVGDAGQDVVCVQNTQEESRYWRLPGGPRSFQDKDSIDTIIRTVSQQTGMRVLRHQIRKLGPQKVEKRFRKKPHSVRYYKAALTPEQYLDHMHTADNLLLRLVPLSILRKMDLFLHSHRDALASYGVFPAES